MTVKLDHGKVTVARILIDSVIDRQGLIQTGDVILQVSKQIVTSVCRDRTKVQNHKTNTQYLIFIYPTMQNSPINMYMFALFDR